ncbi:MAG: hypothetical protein ABJL44_03575 [Algibacter sp.]
MRNLLTLALSFFISIKLFAQTDGITYQAVIIGPDALELPGFNSEGNIFPLETVTIRFTIFDQNDVEEFQEIQITETDEFGRVNLLIGDVNHDEFTQISWDGTNKDLKVEIDFEGGSSFVDMSREHLTFLPYAYHRNITATGTLSVDDDTFLNGELTVELPTHLNSTLEVNNQNATTLTGDLTVDGVTNLNNSLDVNNKSATNLTGSLNVGEVTGLEDVDAPTVLNGTLDVVGKTTVTDFEATGQAAFNELTARTLEVLESSTLNGISSIEGVNAITGVNTITGENNIGNLVDETFIKGKLDIESNEQIIIKSNLNGSDKDITKYPVKIEGGQQGLAIVVNQSRTNANNFVSFWDTTTYTGATTISGEVLTTKTPTMWGRIEGEIESEFGNNADYLFDQSSLDYDIYDGEIDRGFAIASAAIGALQLIKSLADYRACAGFGACVAAPGPADIIFSGAQVVSDGIQVGFAQDALNRARENLVTYDENKLKYEGVTYASGAGDYAEYLLRADVNETMTYGDIVGVVGGEISKRTVGASKMMVVSLKPIVLGNMPQKNKESRYEKVAFMGQVPVKVYGKVNVGDYIIPSGKNDGIGLGISPSQITAKDIKNIVGVAWSKSDNLLGFNMINVAVGINNNDDSPVLEELEKKVNTQAIEIDNLKNQIAEIFSSLEKLEDKSLTLSKKSSEKEPIEESVEVKTYDDRKYEVVETATGEVVYWELKREDFEKGLALAEEQMREGGVDIENNYYWKKLKEDPTFKDDLIDSLMDKIGNQLHYHKDIDKHGGH